jgi:hypothetical protein
MDKNYKRSKEILESRKKSYASKEEKIEDLNKKMTQYKKENKWMKQDDGLKEKYNHEVEVMEAYINREKQIIKGDIDSVIEYAQRINESILPYIKGTDANAAMRVKVNTMRCAEIETELKKLEEERESIPKDIQEYTQEGREKVQKINNKIEILENEKSKLTNDNEMYTKREELLIEYKQNAETIANYRENAKRLGIMLETTPTTPMSTPTTPASAPTTPMSTPTTPTSAPTTPMSTPTTPASTPTTPISTPTTPASAPTTPMSTPTTPASTPTTPISTPTTPERKKDLEIRIGKDLTVTHYTKTGYKEEVIPIGDYKDSLKRTPEQIYDELCRKLKVDPNKDNKDNKEIMEISEKVNPIIWEALRTVDTEYLANYIDRLMDNDIEKSKIDIIYDEDQYKTRSIFDRVKSLGFVYKALNKKEIEKIERYAYRDVNERKIARMIPKRDKKTKKLKSENEPMKDGKSEFIERLKKIDKINDDPEQGKDSSTIERENKTKKKIENEKSDDYLDRF